jgi:hypothetical protein
MGFTVKCIRDLPPNSIGLIRVTRSMVSTHTRLAYKLFYFFDPFS